MTTPVTPEKAPKAMSSRLLTMKFMQRAAASPSSPTTPEPSLKRRKTDDSPAFDVDSLADKRAIQIALAEEESKRQAALDRQAAAAGDTRWVLNFEDHKGTPHSTIRVVQAGFATIDNSLSDITQKSDHPAFVGRRSFGKFNRTIEKLQDPDAESSSSDSDDENESEEDDDDDSDDEDGPSAMIKESRERATQKLKAERKAKRKAEKAESVRLAEKRKKKEVKLNRLSSISGGGERERPETRPCHRCGEVGHLQADCTKRARDRHTDDNDRPRKSRKSK